MIKNAGEKGRQGGHQCGMVPKMPGWLGTPKRGGE